MSDRDAQRREFLSHSGWAQADQAPLAGDASNRSYVRLRQEGHSAILMDAPPALGEDTAAFCHISEHLQSLGLSAPKILATDTVRGFLLLEDLGNGVFTGLIADYPEIEEELYLAATDVLIALRGQPLPNVTAFDAALMSDQAALVLDTYQHPDEPASDATRHAFLRTLRDLLSGIAPFDPVLLLRDYHADNLIWLPDRQGIRRVGILDFQDAMFGHPAYDLVSLLQDVRRPVSPGVAQAARTHFCTLTGSDPERFETAYTILGAVRALRILAVFARLCGLPRKRHYADMIPAVWRILQTNLQHIALAPMAVLLNDALPEPDAGMLSRLTAP